MMPKAKSCTPEKIAMIDARKGKPERYPFNEISPDHVE